VSNLARNWKILLAAVAVAPIVSASYLYINNRHGSSRVESSGQLQPISSLRDAVTRVKSLRYTMTMANTTFRDSYTVTYMVVETKGANATLRVSVTKPPMNITLRMNRENGTVYEVSISNETSTITYNESRASYIGFNVLKDALLPLVNPSVMSQIIDWSTMTSLDKNFELRILDKKQVSISGHEYQAYILLLRQPAGAQNPIQGFYNMTYTVIDWKGIPVLYDMKVHRMEGTVSMHLEDFRPEA
jgi:hypothetical protein